MKKIPTPFLIEKFNIYPNRVWQCKVLTIFNSKPKICSEWMLNVMQYGEGYSIIRYSWKEAESKWEMCIGKRWFPEK